MSDTEHKAAAEVIRDLAFSAAQVENITTKHGHIIALADRQRVQDVTDIVYQHAPSPPRPVSATHWKIPTPTSTATSSAS